MTPRALVGLLCAALVLPGCADQPLGRGQPACDPVDLSSAMILAVQAVPGAAYAPCLSQLEVGWSYEHLVAESGRSRFWLSSDRLGERFVEVTTEATCDRDGSVPAASDEPGIARFERVDEADLATSIVIVPEGAEAGPRRYAEAIAAAIDGTELAGRRVVATVAQEPSTTQQRIAEALAAGRPVIVVGTRGREQATVELQLPAGPGDAVSIEPALPLAGALSEIADHLGEARYRATWYYVFDGGCVTYDVDAHGSTVATVPGDVARALGFLSLAGPRERAREQGMVVP